jgi:hypothetical protein
LTDAPKNDHDWVTGDILGLRLPAHAAALREGGVPFLTEAFRTAGALVADNRVTCITQCEECPGGSTGRKLLLSVEYEKPAAGLHHELFVKFSRDFDDPIRDRGRTQMELEIRFAQLSRTPGFPIAVPVCYYADYHAVSGTGVLITQRIGFGRDGIERHYDKCRDDELPELLAHYQALLTALARLAGADQAGRLPASVSEQFAFDPSRLTVGERAPYTARQLQNRVARYAEFAHAHAALLPANIRAPAFLARLHEEVARFPEQEIAIRKNLGSRPEFVALCHWNANVDNAWFWRGAGGQLECGLMDWGCVSRMNVAMAIWGAMSAADTALWDRHLDELLALFVAEFQRSGGPALDLPVLKRQLMLYIALMGLTWLLDAPAYLRALVPDLAETQSRHDPSIRGNEAARTQLQMLTTFLNLWETQDFGGVLDEFLAAE